MQALLGNATILTNLLI